MSHQFLKYQAVYGCDNICAVLSQKMFGSVPVLVID
jgi:hypothetical protein